MRNILSGFLGGVVGGAAVDLIFITYVGPSALFSLIGITNRCDVFLGHVLLGGILGIIFVFILERLPKYNIWLLGVLWGYFCMLIVGGIPGIFYYCNAPSFGIIISALGVWTLYGLILATAVFIPSRRRRIHSRQSEQE